MKLHKSFIAKFVQASLFSCLSFSAYAQDVNSEENKPLPLNDEGYKVRKESITKEINKAVEDIKEKEKEVKYDIQNEGGARGSENQSVSSVYNIPTDAQGSYLFSIVEGSRPLSNLKLINNTDIASTTEVFSTRWVQGGGGTFFGPLSLV